MATPECFRSVADRFDISKSTGHKIFARMSVVLKDNACKKAIVWPKEDHQINSIVTGFQRKKGMTNVIGAIDGSHIPIKGPAESPKIVY